MELDGTVELPEVGAVQLAGLTLDEAERKIEDAYEAEYVEPYALLRVVNNRVLVFPGEAGQATVITLENQNTTVIEVLAQAGGIRARGRSKRIKLIRQKGDEDLVFLMDLSTVDSLELPAQWCKPTTSSTWSPTRRLSARRWRTCRPGANDHHGQFFVFDVSSVVESRLMELQTTP